MTLLELIEEHEHGFLIIKKRFYYLKKIEEELLKTTKGKMYEIRGDVMHQMLVDSYYMLVIDLASIARGMIKKGGFFKRLGNFISFLKCPTLKEVQKSMQNGSNSGDGHLENSVLHYSTESFYRIFPKAKIENRNQATKEDINDLKDHFYSLFEEVIKDRDRNKAHAYEQSESKKEVVPFVSLSRLEKKFKEIEGILNDFRMLHTFSQYGSNDVNFSNSSRFVETIVDMILIGDRDLIDNCFGINKDLFDGCGKYTYMYRDEYYRKVHCHHELNIQRTHSLAAAEVMKTGDYNLLFKLKSIPLNFDIFLRRKFGAWRD